MKGSKNFPKVSPEDFRNARDSLKIDFKRKVMKPIEFNNNNKIPKKYLRKEDMKMEYKIKGFSFEEGTGSFYLEKNNEKYKVKFDKSMINILVDDSYHGYVNAFDFNRDTKIPTWYMEHVCGLSGFGLGEDDKCYGCNPRKSSDSQIGRFHSKLRYDFFDGKIHEKIEVIVVNVEKKLKELLSDLEKEI